MIDSTSDGQYLVAGAGLQAHPVEGVGRQAVERLLPGRPLRKLPWRQEQRRRRRRRRKRKRH